MSDERDGFTLALVTFVDEVEAYWSAHGMRSVDRRRLIAELERDLYEAIQNGASSHELIRDDVSRFATSVATANGIPLQEPREPAALTVGALVGTGLLGGLAGALVAWILVYNGAAHDAFAGASDLPEILAPLLLHSVAALITLAGVIIAMRWRFRHDPTISRIVRPAGLLAALGGIISVGPIMFVAAATNFSTSPLVLLIEVAIAAAFCGGAIAVVARSRLPHT
jgi:hypothetical protein